MGWKNRVANATMTKRLGSVAMALAVVVAGLTSVSANAQLTGIASTKHNLGSTGTGANKFSGTTEICVFCHTPHGADNTAAVPLWNRKLGVNDAGATNVYTTYDSLGTTSLDGRTAPVGSVSIACLSCHDGTQSMSSVINQPGSGLVTAFATGSWSGLPAANGGKIGPTGVGAPVTNLGTDLSNDHPIGIQYAGGGYSTTALTGPGKDGDFKAAKNKELNGTTVWWVDTEATANNTREKTDMMLYTRSASAGYAASGTLPAQTLPEPFVECASCHDPHSTNTTFLRIENAQSAVCLACHTK
jgi:predicted CXXCH cytochrome family protein